MEYKRHMMVNGVECYGIIYRIRNKINNKCYIGQTTRKNGFNGRYCAKGEGIERVYNYYNSKKDDNTINKHLYSSIKKYGFNNFEVEEIFDIAYSKEELDKLECLYIDVYQLTNIKYGYNNKTGGGNGKHTVASKCLDGTMVICLNDKKIFRSYVEASRYYNVNSYWIKNRIVKNKHKNYIQNYINGELKFKIVTESMIVNLNNGYALCCCCGKQYKKKQVKKHKTKKIYNNNQKYCNNCANELKKHKFKHKKHENVLCLNNLYCGSIKDKPNNKYIIANQNSKYLIESYINGITYLEMIQFLKNETDYYSITKVLKENGIPIVNRDILKSLNKWEDWKNENIQGF